jgi:hypothetical protein
MDEEKKFRHKYYGPRSVVKQKKSYVCGNNNVFRIRRIG